MYWFYVKTSSVMWTFASGEKVRIHPLASTMSAMKTTSRGAPAGDLDASSKACSEAFALACCYLGGRDLIEEMVASKYWPLYRDSAPVRLENVRLPIMSEPEGIPFPRFDSEKVKEKDAREFVIAMEETTTIILGEITTKKYLARKTEAGTMP